jgi:manganese-dependent inorganic pyrophosphatase
MEKPIYVIGHVNPDTDSIAAAIGYAWLIRERDEINAVAARAGAINPQTAWLLKYLGLENPILLTDASPKFESVMRRLDTTTPDKPLQEAWAILGRTGGIAPIVNTDGTPYGLVTGRSLFNYLSRHVGPHPQQQNVTINEILDVPCHEAVDQNVASFQSSMKIRDVINRILREEGDEFWVVDEANRYLGVCRQRDLLNPPRLQLILVDHNEAQQAIRSLEEAELLEILDHHRLGNPSTHLPIRFTVDIVGSTSTLVSERILEAGLSAPPKIAAIMLGGLLSDTLILKSPTSTDRDRDAAERLSRWAFVGGSALVDETIESFGHKLLTAGSGLSARTAVEVINGDMKIYNAGKYHFAIAQAEVSDLMEVVDHLPILNEELGNLQRSKGLDFAMLMVTDVVSGSSRLLFANPPAVLDELPYHPLHDGTRMADGVVSRKKQLLPVVLGLLET